MRKGFSLIISKQVTKVSVCVVAFCLCSLGYAQEFPVYEHEPIVVTATRVPTTFSQVGRSIVVITRDEIETAHVQSVQELLQYASGVDLRQRGPYGTQADVTIRGGTFEQTLILIDGIKMNDPQTGHHNLDLPLQLDDVERIEILKGHGSRLYGPNAFGGVINIITRSGKRKIISLNSSVGDFGLFDTGFLLSYFLGNFRHYLSISGKRSKGYRHNTDFGIYHGYYRLVAKLSSGECEISIGYIDKKFGANSFYSNLFQNQREHTKSRFFRAGLNLVNNRILFSPRVYWRRHVDDFILDYEAPEWYHNHHETDVYGFEFQSTFDLRWSVSTFGGEIGNEIIRSSNLGDHSRTRGGFFFEHQFQPVANLVFTLGANAYCYSDWGWSVWPGVDLSFLFAENLRAHGSVGRSFRVPTYTELYYDSPANKGNPQLKPEQAWTYEAGLSWKKERSGGRFTIFRREGYNLIDWVRKSVNSFWEARNIARTNTNGVEINFWFNTLGRKYLPIHRVQVSYTFLDSDKEIKGLESKYILDHLKHQVTLDIGHPLVFQVQGNWKLRFEQRVSGEKYVLCDSQIYKKFENVELFARITNLFDTDYSEVGEIPMPGRWVVTGLKFGIRPGK
ncbi:hypothetical protein DRQ00_10050 [candidate division KSB1 bacterium]|nr:MAG: hypothetical protein DRQ00_10050 [candidate division KSB1 bacterium]